MADEITARLAALVKRGRELVDGLESDADDGWIDDADVALYESWLASVGNLILAIGGAESAPFVEYRRIVTSQLNPAGLKTYVVRQTFDIVLGVYEQWSQGAVRRLEDIIAATTFDGFVDAAAAHRDAGHDAEAAAIAGSVLDHALRRIASCNGVAVSGSLVDLTASLTAAGVFETAQGERFGEFAGRQDRAARSGWADVETDGLVEATRGLIEGYL